MIIFCSKCGINWARLWSLDSEEGDETTEFCPLCRTDHHLQPGNDIISFIRCPFSGKITDVESGSVLTLAPPKPTPPPYYRIPAMSMTEAEYERRCDAALEAYFLTGDSKEYFKVFKQ